MKPGLAGMSHRQVKIMKNEIANKLIEQLDIDPDSALAALARYACQPTKFRRVPNRKPMQREAGKLLNWFRCLCADAVIHGVTDAHLIAASRANLRYTVLKCGGEATSRFWSGMHGRETHLYRVVACDLLDNAIDLAKAEKFKPVREEQYTLAEIKRICARSGSRFFKELEKNERVSLEWAPATHPGQNIIRVKNGRGESKFYRFVTKKGGCEFIGNSLLG